MGRLPGAVRSRNWRKGMAARSGTGTAEAGKAGSVSGKAGIKRGELSVGAGDSFFLSEIFKRKGWVEYDGHEAVQERFLKWMGRMTGEQKELFLELTERFYWKYDYTRDIVVQLNRILTQFNNYKSYYVLRCVKYDDERDVKSPGSVAYEIKNPLVQSRLVKPVRVLSKMKSLDGVSIDFKSSLFIIVDDFVGSGDSAVKCIKDLLMQHKEMEGRMVVMCLVAMSQGVERLKSFHVSGFAEDIKVSVFAECIQDRGISDSYSGYNLKRNIQRMQEIESIVNPYDGYCFGYGKSEALVCLKRCPNNTFPVYWYGKNAPFAR